MSLLHAAIGAWVVATALMLMPAGAAPAPEGGEKRVALVIGISAYQNAPALANPVNDARAIGEALRRLNFEVQELFDPDYRQFSRGVRDFGIRAQNADAAVVYYAGHGIQADHENYLLPVDAKLEHQHDLLFEAMPLRLVLGEVAQARKIGIILLDACRNNPFTERMSRSFATSQRAIATSGPGLARVDDVPRNTMVVMATKADQGADDGDTGHSPFAEALLAHFQIPGLELGLFFRSVRDTVLKATNNRQEPYIFSSLGAEPFYFHPRPPNHPPEIGPVRALQVTDRSSATRLGIPKPTDPDGDALTVRVTGLPRSGEVRVDGRPARSNDLFSVDQFVTATYTPEGKPLGPVGSVDILVEDGRGGSATASLPITVISSNQPPVVDRARTVRFVPLRLGIAPPTDPDGDPLTVTVTVLPRGRVHNGTAVLSIGDRLQPADLPRLTFTPDVDVFGRAGSFGYMVEDGRGGRTEGKVDVEVADAPPEGDAAPRPEAPRPPAGKQLAGLQSPAPEAREPQRTGAEPTTPAGPREAAKPFQDCPTCPILVALPGGSFVMGQGARDPAAAPALRVTLRPFAVGLYPVTVGDWKACLAESGCGFMPRMAEVNDRTPVHDVSWDDAQQFLAWLSRKTGKKYRLPSEAEWEYAARGGAATRYWWGDEVGVANANCRDCGGPQDARRPLPVDALRPNPFGIYDMLGGVAEWTQDCWFPDYHGAPSDGAAREAPSCMKRVLRGGSFRTRHDEITVASRGSYDASVRYLANGFRVARDLE
ncbi:MAG TPA: SUMF1/EgtB/PvdO family nonheme iron enzyme [Acetobacteraceae bacterium]|nr:SUMF1/EgtB/PvdO family nonheme iron enzyme [Acetobacteraceae bacterium]